MPWCRSPP